MKRILDIVLTSLYLLHFGLSLGIFHIIQVIAFNVFGKNAHKKTVDWLNFFLTYGLILTGAKIRFKQTTDLPTDRPIIFIANHQSMFDIPGIIYFLRKHTPVFVSKIELSKGIPSISYNLRKSGAALINRRDGKQAIMEIARLAKFVQDNNYSAVIFPEGTRTVTGEMKPFAVGGVSMLLKRAPKALIVPIAIQGTGKLNPKKSVFPLVSFTDLSWTTLQPIEPTGLTAEQITEQSQQIIQAELDKTKSA